MGVNERDGAATEVPVPTAVRTQLAHASAQAVADASGADVLHIKGASLDPERNPGRPLGTDADVLVRPAHVRGFMRALQESGWVLWCDFEEGSLFEHAASLHHRYFGMLDVHQLMPGLHRDPAAAFAELWADREVRVIAQVRCPAPGATGEHVVMLLHAGRTPGKEVDVDNHWHRLGEDERAAVTAMAHRHGATVGIDAALGRLHLHTGPEADLWRLMVDGSDRLAEWTARWRAARSPRERAVLAIRAARVNRFVLGQRLGHPPTRAEIRREWWRRLGEGAVAVAGRSRGASRAGGAGAAGGTEGSGGVA